jgi:hypothetical protein
LRRTIRPGWRPPSAAAEDRNGKKAGVGLVVLLELAAATVGVDRNGIAV